MHELPVIRSVLDICLKHAANHRVQKITAVQLKVGELSDLEPEWMQKYFDFVSKGTIAEGASLRIQRVPLVVRCAACSQAFPVDVKAMKDIECPHCKGTKVSYVSGREYRVENIEVM